MLTSSFIKELTRSEGFETAGVARALAHSDGEAFREWAEAGMAGRMGYLTDYRAAIRMDPKNLLASARSILVVGKVYNAPRARGERPPEELAWISRYAWGDDYHIWMRQRLQRMVGRLLEVEPFDYRICVDTAPLLERSYAREAGLGWIGRNTCLISQGLGSWLFLGEVLTSLDLEADGPPPDRCGTCRRCIDACPTQALVEKDGRWQLDARLCISYFTIELHGAVPEEHRGDIGGNVFGCDICQDVCPWNRRAALTTEPAFQPRNAEPPLEAMAALTEPEFRAMFRETPVSRARYAGFMRNVALAMGNSGVGRFRAPLEALARSPMPLVAEHAVWALRQLAS
ncbi:MAG: tRNA epoxyqueuosine(34) reductase QueG [Acidobacteria bacterium]|nr:tRNA epoxyqueuosine(34) reductase QueG [Acidobacteriota bacterium]